MQKLAGREVSIYGIASLTNTTEKTNSRNRYTFPDI
jgi:hypothetical protein